MFYKKLTIQFLFLLIFVLGTIFFVGHRVNMLLSNIQEELSKIGLEHTQVPDKAFNLKLKLFNYYSLIYQESKEQGALKKQAAVVSKGIEDFVHEIKKELPFKESAAKKILVLWNELQEVATVFIDCNIKRSILKKQKNETSISAFKMAGENPHKKNILTNKELTALLPDNFNDYAQRITILNKIKDFFQVHAFKTHDWEKMKVILDLEFYLHHLLQEDDLGLNDASFLEQKNNFYQTLKLYEEFDLLPIEKYWQESLKKQMAVYFKDRDDLFALNKKREDVVLKIESLWHKIGDLFSQDIFLLFENQREKIKENVVILKEQYNKLVLSLFLSLLVIFCLFTLIVWRHFIRPVIILTNTVKRISINGPGEQVELKVFGELNDLIVSVNQMSQKLKEMFKEQEDVLRKVYKNSKMASLGELAAEVAHEINNPLSAIRLSVDDLEKELLDKSLVIPESQKEFEILRDNINRIGCITKDLRSYAHDNEDWDENVDVCYCIDKSLGLFERALQNEGIKVKLLIKSQIEIRGNNARFQQAIINVLSNAKDAVKYSKVKEIQITTTSSNNSHIIAISDSGCGISKEILPKIFEPFVSTKKVGEGVGLGMFIVHTVIKKMSGEVKIESSLEKGSTVSFIF